MNTKNKIISLTFIVLVLLSGLLLFSVNSVSAYAVSKPSVPQFSVKFIDESYDEPPTQTTDPYTGITTTQPGSHVDRRWIEVTIKNQPFTVTGNTNLFYLVEYKGYFGGDNDWHVLSPGGSSFRPDTGYIEQSDSGYTVLSGNRKFDPGVKVDFRVKAVIGHLQHADWWSVVVDSSSAWSNIQTFTIPGKPSPSPVQTDDSSNTQTPELYNPTQQYPLILILMVIAIAACIIAVLLVVIVYQYRQKVSSRIFSGGPVEVGCEKQNNDHETKHV